MSKSLTYRPDIDGLRAIAVLGVVFFHAGLGFPGGYVGVDVFFVISGFLITSLLLKDLRNGTFAFLDFWERRARRILPALTVVVVAALAAGWFLLLPEAYTSLAKSVVAIVALSSNILFWRDTGYFEAAAEEKPLLHTWSLSLEEQFYLFIPLLLWLLFRFRRFSWVAPMLVLGGISSFALSIYGSYRLPGSTFFLLPARAWELAAGSLLAFATPVTRPALRGLMAWIGLLAILLPIFLYWPGIRFPGLTALPPVAGAALLIWTGLRSTTMSSLPLANRLLATKPLVWVGLLSYSLYLWHWPLFAFHKYVCLTAASPKFSLLIVAASFLLAWLSLYFVERPFRSKSLVHTKNQVFGLSVAAIIIVLVPALFLSVSQGFPQRVPANALQVIAANKKMAVENDLSLSDIPNNLVKLGSPGHPPKIFVWGDSHAMAILPVIDIICKENEFGALAATSSSTPPILDWTYDLHYGLKEQAPLYNRAILDFIKSKVMKGDISCVVLAARWSLYLNLPGTADSFEKSMKHTLRELDATGCMTIVLQDVPDMKFNVPKALALEAMWKRATSQLSIERDDYNRQCAAQIAMFGRADKDLHHVVVLDPSSAFTGPVGNMIASDLNGSFYVDNHHLNTRGSMRLKAAFETALPDGSRTTP